MPQLEKYIAEVTITVTLRTEEAGEVATYGVTREAKGLSGSFQASDVVNTATLAALAASKSMVAGVDNAEARRLK